MPGQGCSPASVRFQNRARHYRVAGARVRQRVEPARFALRTRIERDDRPELAHRPPLEQTPRGAVNVQLVIQRRRRREGLRESRASGQALPAVDRDDGARHEARDVGGQEHDRRPELGRVAEPAHRDRAGDYRLAGRANAVDLHVVARQLSVSSALPGAWVPRAVENGIDHDLRRPDFIKHCVRKAPKKCSSHRGIDQLICLRMATDRRDARVDGTEKVGRKPGVRRSRFTSDA